ncbi:putative non-specific serine/threonine protein kinase [Helianthus annuus]|uniref:Non-specific serine/threonine protein kinase n=1 Tax=Helianthus annuus TaxID=4232 RepID=A0A9K3II48_HELAN|nr:putative non-specific serine/threonine protein kinase [Helianthus annuus]KAJ0549197.1 putative non-specific serine/threonine protein kinase [Helianthus annuus]KAJ0562149.1 putative non-specific serine/threonine protein kinase [Helianthus annuus]KAJ0727522.1 putative non-specific serine/threonine protein kinase [Helianthus annuus]KAJ0730320.1 putative non-specific serine/threonine protein kinase [Helianthus annuus]
MAITISTPLLMSTILFILTCIPIPSFSCPSHQKQALLHFKSTLTTTISSSSYHMVQLKSWNPTSDCCSWERVNCTETKTITELHLDGLVVPLPDIDPAPVFSDILAPLFHIRSLKLLDISNNSLHDKIPGDGFVNLTELVHLDMKDNWFNGSIPRQLFGLTNLHYLDMSNNMLEGGTRTRVRVFSELNYTEGGLSVEVGKLLNLESLILSANFLSGKLPQEIGKLTRLRELLLQNNQFSSGVPSSTANFKNLETLDLSQNSFSMQIPASIGTLPNITAVDLSNNKFTGPIPSSMQNMSKLVILGLHNNKLVGKIPTWLFSFTSLDTLFIGGKGNGLTWNNKAKFIPNYSLKFLSLISCNISGQFPEWISSQKRLICWRKPLIFIFIMVGFWRFDTKQWITNRIGRHDYNSVNG